MKFFIFSVFFLSFLNSNSVYSTSTTFEQNLIFNEKADFSSLNSSPSTQNIHSFAIVGSVGIFGKKLYDYGYFSPFGLIPENIRSLSPLAYQNKTRSSNRSPFKNFCNGYYDERSTFDYRVSKNENYEICYNSQNSNSFSSNEKLINRYIK